MKKSLIKLLAALLSLMLLCGCSANNAANNKTDSENTPPAANGTQQENPGETPESNEDNTHQDTAPEKEELPSTALTADELREWESYFNTTANNGLLRFPYSDPEGEPDQLAPYLSLLFYDIGEAINEDERAMLEQAGVMMETDTFRLTREFINSYLFEHFHIPAEKTENLLDAANLGTYLIWYDAWYNVHGDCAYYAYTFDRGERFEDGTIKLYYFNNFLSVAQDDSEMDYADTEMIVTLKEMDGRWCVTAHKINRSTWNEQ